MKRLGSLLTVTPNAALDRSWLLQDTQLRGTNRPVETLVRAGGKGVNVARAWMRLGGGAVASGFAGGHAGVALRAGLQAEGIDDAFVTVTGETRTCALLCDPGRGLHVEVNEAGPAVTPRDLRRLEHAVKCALHRRPVALVLSGSLPPGADAALYARLIRRAQRAGVPAVIDSHGAPLAQALAARPWVIAPNRSEFAALIGRRPRHLAGLARAAQAVRASGVQWVAVTLGAEGALLVGPEDVVLHAPAPPVPALSAVGSGDSFLAGLLAGLLSEAPPPVALALAVAAGADNCRRLGAAGIASRAVRTLAQRVTCLDPRAVRRASAA